QQAFAAYNDGRKDAILVRIGLNAGEPVAEDADLFGTAVQAAARIAARARPGQILVSDVVRQLAAGKPFRFNHVGRFSLKGFRSAYEAPHGSVAPGPVSSGAESKRRRCPR